MKTEVSGVYVFHGVGAQFAAAVYASVGQAAADIERHRLSGLLTWYPIGSTVYDYAVGQGLFPPREYGDGKFIQSFTSAALEHHHFENGRIDGG